MLPAIQKMYEKMLEQNPWRERGSSNVKVITVPRTNFRISQNLLADLYDLKAEETCLEYQVFFADDNTHQHMQDYIERDIALHSDAATLIKECLYQMVAGTLKRENERLEKMIWNENIIDRRTR